MDQPILAFPPSGFGFWYYLGQYKQIANINYKECIGASSGALLCLCTLLDDDKRTFDFLKVLAYESMMEYRSTSYFINIHTVARLFIDKLYKHINWNVADISKLRVITSRISTKDFTISRRETIPETKEQLKELIFASSFIPILSNYNGNYFYYEIDDEQFIDGGIVEYYVPSNYFATTQSVTSLYMPTTFDEIYKSYLDGMNAKLTVIYSPTDHSAYLINPLLLFILFFSVYFRIKIML
jgi:hypothetical protein